MHDILIYSVCGIALFFIGLLGVLLKERAVRKIISINVMGVGVFMLLVAVAKLSPGSPDPVPHAMALTGIVVAVAGTALALNFLVRIHQLDKLASHEKSK